MSFSGLGLFAVVWLFSGGGMPNDMLSMVDPDFYWKSQGVEVTTENMLAKLPVAAKPAGDISALIAQLGDNEPKVREAATKKIGAMGPEVLGKLREAAKSNDAEVANRAEILISSIEARGRGTDIEPLLAIRTLGLAKRKEALPGLVKLLESKQLFVADYARRAIAQIEGKPYQWPAVTEAQMEKDLWMLPAECDYVGQVTVSGGESLSAAKLISKFPSQIKQLLMASVTKDQFVTQLNGGGIEAVKRVGNFRIDGFTFGATGNAETNGFVVVIVRGLYDPKKVKGALIETIGGKSGKIQGYDTVEFFGEYSQMVLISDRMLILTEGSGAKKLIDPMLASIKNANQPLRKNADLVKLIGKVDRKKNTSWLVFRASDATRKANMFAQLESLTVGANVKDGLLHLRVDATGTSAELTTKMVERLNDGLAKSESKEASEMWTPQVVQFIKSVKVKQDGKALSVSGQLQTNSPEDFLAGSLSLMMILGPAITQ